MKSTGLDIDSWALGPNGIGLTASVIENVFEIHPKLLRLPFALPIHGDRVEIDQRMLATGSAHGDVGDLGCVLLFHILQHTKYAEPAAEQVHKDRGYELLIQDFL